jgi:hypothetical protein
MIPNVKPSQLYPGTGLNSAIGHVPPQSLAAAGIGTGPWIAVTPGAKWLIVALLSGALGGGSEQVDIEQATSAAGAGAKALATAAISAQTVNNRVDETEVSLDLLDINNGFAFVRAKVTNTGGTGALVALSVKQGPNPYAA